MLRKGRSSLLLLLLLRVVDVTRLRAMHLLANSRCQGNLLVAVREASVGFEPVTQ